MGTFGADEGLGGYIYRTSTANPSPPFNRNMINRLTEFQTGKGICEIHLKQLMKDFEQGRVHPEQHVATNSQIRVSDKTLDKEQRRVQYWFNASFGSLLIQGWANAHQMKCSAFIYHVVQHQHEWRNSLFSPQATRNILKILPANVLTDRNRKGQGLNLMCVKLAEKA